MRNMFPKRTICCKLTLPSPAVAQIQETARVFNAAATYCAQVAWDTGITNKDKLHHLVYGATRLSFGLGAQLACCARDKAAEAVKAMREAPERYDRYGQLIPKTCPLFGPTSSIRYDARTYRLMSMDRVSLYTLSGRVIGQLVLGDFQRQHLYDQSWKIGGAELVRRNGAFYLHVTQSKAAPSPDEPMGTLGVDAERAGVAVELINPRNTSTCWSACGHTAKANRKTQADFCCVQCGHASPADYNAAINISRAAVNRPMVSDAGHLWAGSARDKLPALAVE